MSLKDWVLFQKATALVNPLSKPALFEVFPVACANNNCLPLL
jgi:hypothetical protein